MESAKGELRQTYFARCCSSPKFNTMICISNEKTQREIARVVTDDGLSSNRALLSCRTKLEKKGEKQERNWKPHSLDPLVPWFCLPQTPLLGDLCRACASSSRGCELNMQHSAFSCKKRSKGYCKHSPQQRGYDENRLRHRVLLNDVPELVIQVVVENVIIFAFSVTKNVKIKRDRTRIVTKREINRFKPACNVGSIGDRGTKKRSKRWGRSEKRKRGCTSNHTSMQEIELAWIRELTW